MEFLRSNEFLFINNKIFLSTFSRVNPYLRICTTETQRPRSKTFHESNRKSQCTLCLCGEFFILFTSMIPFQRFVQKTVLITGASRGIGAGLARRFAQEGVNLVLSANETKVQGVAADLEKSGLNALGVLCDGSSKSQVEHLFATAVKRFGVVDVSIQHAGV